MYCLDPYIMLDNKIYLNLQYGYSFNLTFNSCLWKWVWIHNKQTIMFLVNILKTHNRDLSERYAPEGSFKLIFIYTAQFHKSQFSPEGFLFKWQLTTDNWAVCINIRNLIDVKSQVICNKPKSSVKNMSQVFMSKISSQDACLSFLWKLAIEMTQDISSPCVFA